MSPLWPRKSNTGGSPRPQVMPPPNMPPVFAQMAPATESTIPLARRTKGDPKGDPKAFKQLKEALILLKEAPLSGLKSSVDDLLIVIGRLPESSKTINGWVPWIEEFESLWFLVSKTQALKGGRDALCEPLIDKLDELFEAIRKAQDAQNLESFLDNPEKRTIKDVSAAVHRKELQAFRRLLETEILKETGQTYYELHERFKRELNEKQNPHTVQLIGLTSIIRSTTIEGEVVDVSSHNNVTGESRVYNEAVDSKWKSNGGNVHSHNVASR